MAHVILCPYKSNSTWISVLVTLHTHKKGKHKYIIHTRHWRQKALGLPRRCPTISDVLGLSHRHARTGAHTITLQHNSASYMSTPFCNTTFLVSATNTSVEVFSWMMCMVWWGCQRKSCIHWDSINLSNYEAFIQGSAHTGRRWSTPTTT